MKTGTANNNATFILCSKSDSFYFLQYQLALGTKSIPQIGQEPFNPELLLHRAGIKAAFLQ
jgi:hypothetical protein